MHGIDQRNHVLDWCLRQNAMTEIENVSRPSSRLLQDRLSLRAQLIFVGKQRYRFVGVGL